VLDTGVGIDDCTRERLFEPLFTTDAETGIPLITKPFDVGSLSRLIRERLK